MLVRTTQWANLLGGFKVPRPFGAGVVPRLKVCDKNMVPKNAFFALHAYKNVGK